MRLPVLTQQPRLRIKEVHMPLCTTLTGAVTTAFYTPAEADSHSDKPPKKLTLLSRKILQYGISLCGNTINTACAEGTYCAWPPHGASL